MKPETDPEKSTIPWKTRLLATPDNLWMAGKSAWISRERGLAVFAGVFLASLVITTVLAYGVGLSQLALQDSFFFNSYSPCRAYIRRCSQSIPE